MKFSERLKESRTEKNIKAEELAVAIGVKRRIIFSYEKNETRPSFGVLLAIADYFGISLDYLTGRSDSPRYEDFVINTEIKNKKEPP